MRSEESVGFPMRRRIFGKSARPGFPKKTNGRFLTSGVILARLLSETTAQGMGLRAMEEVRFARDTARKSLWCAVEHRVIDWASRSAFRAESEVVIMIAVVTDEMHGSDRDSDLI